MALVEELTAETFYRAIVARNAWRKLHAKRAREENLVDNTAATGMSGEALVDLQRTLAPLAAPPDDLREPLILCAQGGLGYKEIAAQLNITVAAVKIRIYRARQKLRVTDDIASRHPHRSGDPVSRRRSLAKSSTKHRP